MFKNLYENFYAKRAGFLAIILIICIIGLLFSFAATKMCNDIIILGNKAKYVMKDVIKSDIVSVIAIGLAALIIKSNKKKERNRRREYINKNQKDCNELFSVLRGKKRN